MVIRSAPSPPFQCSLARRSAQTASRHSAATAARSVPKCPRTLEGMDHQATSRIIANNIVAKTQIPSSQMYPGLDYSGQLGTGGTDQSLTSRGPAHGPGSLPQVHQRGAHTSRSAYAQAAVGVQQPMGTSDAVRTTPAVQTGPITPAQALKRYGESSDSLRAQRDSAVPARK